MTIELSPAVSFALQYAQRISSQTLQPIHLLQALMAEPEGEPSQLLADAGLDRALLEAQFSPLAVENDEDVSDLLPPTHWVHSVLQHARRWVHRSPDRTVTTDQVLLALLQRETELTQHLQKIGLSLETLEAAVVGPVHAPIALEEDINLQPASGDWDVARLLDANANRAREALRVLEDYCRFVLNDGVLSGELKAMRHDLADALQSQPLSLASRDTANDVGTQISTTSEHERASLVDVVSANSKRAQEALRCLEEYGKIHDAEFSKRIEQIRYRCYTIERVLVRTSGVRERLAQVRLYALVTEAACRLSLPSTITELAAGGVEMFQLREKDLDDRTLLERAKLVRELTHKVDALFIINDRVDIAQAAGADGVHLGQEDLPLRDARRLLGDDAIIGVSTHDIVQVKRAVLDGADYIGVGPTFPSSTKSFDVFPGLDFVRQTAEETSLPAFVLGGVTLDNVSQVVDAGGSRVATSAALCQAQDPCNAARHLCARLQPSRSN